jgi:DNA polymerase (family 10)
VKLEEAQVLAEQVRVTLEPLCERVVIAGSIRRQKPEVNDIDLVTLPKCAERSSFLDCNYKVRVSETEVWLTLFPSVLKKWGLKVDALGPELLRFSRIEDGFQVDVYRARPETWGVILLVRTGSKQHNVKLCSLARSKGLMLSAAKGVIADDGCGEVVASWTEEEIFAALGLAFVAPKDREVRL